MAYYGKSRHTVCKSDYVSTENMLQDFRGICRYTTSEKIAGIEFEKQNLLLANIRPYLKKVWFANFSGAASTDVLVLKATTIVPGFLKHIIANESFISYVMSAVKGSKMPRGDKSHILNYTLGMPSLAEQQKIADFLSLVDERIEKQRQLVEVLKRYKRGLLSLVFKGNFQMVKLADICDFVSSSHTISNLGARESGIYPVYDAAGLSMYIDTYDMHEEYISIVKDGSGIGRLQKCDKNSSFIGTLGALVAKNCEIDYLFAVLQTIDFSRFATGMAIPHIYYKDYKNTLIPLPSQDTQKNISRLFRNIDIHIEQNSIQLDNILVLKHGLLQQMFI